MKIVEVIEAYGHPNVQGTHRTTFEIIKEPSLTLRGNCIIAVKASKAVADLSPTFKKAVRNDGARIIMTLEAGRIKEKVIGYGSSRLTLNNPISIVIRKSDYICERTLMIRSNKAACDLSRSLIKLSQDPRRKVVITLEVGL
jgi:hypothetical protein